MKRSDFIVNYIVADLSHQMAQLSSLEFDEGKRNELLGLPQTIQSMREEMDRKVGEIVGAMDRLIEELRRENETKMDELRREKDELKREMEEDKKTKRRISSTNDPRSDRGEQENH